MRGGRRQWPARGLPSAYGSVHRTGVSRRYLRDVRTQPVPEDDPLFLIEHIQDLLEEGKSGRSAHQTIRPHAPERFSAENTTAVELENAVQSRICDEDITARGIHGHGPRQGEACGLDEIDGAVLCACRIETRQPPLKIAGAGIDHPQCTMGDTIGRLHEHKIHTVRECRDGGRMVDVRDARAGTRDECGKRRDELVGPIEQQHACIRIDETGVVRTITRRQVRVVAQHRDTRETAAGMCQFAPDRIDPGPVQPVRGIRRRRDQVDAEDGPDGVAVRSDDLPGDQKVQPAVLTHRDGMQHRTLAQLATGPVQHDQPVRPRVGNVQQLVLPEQQTLGLGEPAEGRHDRRRTRYPAATAAAAGAWRDPWANRTRQEPEGLLPEA
ncbi:MAG: hypothetical protein MZV64_31590 [Ignavibacteriales bacterium]|nr:hypothetical protein [Ignavibacteriales bacterium]